MPTEPPGAQPPVLARHDRICRLTCIKTVKRCMYVHVRRRILETNKNNKL